MPFAFALILASGALVSDETVTLRFQPPVGTSVSYLTSTAITQIIPGVPKPVETTTTGTMTLRAVSRANGLTTLETKTGQAKVTVSANAPFADMKDRLEKLASNQTGTTVVDEFCNLREMKMDAKGPDAAFIRQVGEEATQGVQGISYPKGALKVGDTWNAALNLGKTMEKTAPGAKSSGTIPIVFRLVSLEKVGEATFAKISMSMKGAAPVSMEGTPMKLTMSATGESTIDLTTGFLRSSSSVTDTTMIIAGQAMRQHIVTTLKAS